MLDSLVRLSLSLSLSLYLFVASQEPKRHVDGETSEGIYISGLYWITSYPWQTLVVSQTPGSLIYIFTFLLRLLQLLLLFLSAKDYLRLNGLAIHNLSYCGPSFPDTVSFFFRGGWLVGATLFCTSHPSWLLCGTFPGPAISTTYREREREINCQAGWLAALMLVH